MCQIYGTILWLILGTLSQAHPTLPEDTKNLHFTGDQSSITSPYHDIISALELYIATVELLVFHSETNRFEYSTKNGCAGGSVVPDKVGMRWLLAPIVLEVFKSIAVASNILRIKMEECIVWRSTTQVSSLVTAVSSKVNDVFHRDHLKPLFSKAMHAVTSARLLCAVAKQHLSAGDTVELERTSRKRSRGNKRTTLLSESVRKKIPRTILDLESLRW